MTRRIVLLAALLNVPALPVLTAQAKKPFQSQTPSSVTYSIDKDGFGVVEISNTAFELVSEKLLRKTVREKHQLGDIGIQASTTVDAWPLGTDPKQKPLYSVTVEGVDPRTMNGEVLVISRALEEVEWWTVYGLASGARLFDTYTPVAPFSIRRDTLTLRYAGLQIAEDEVKDPRLKAANVVGVVTYASAEKVIREALVTCDDPKRAALLRSLADSNFTLVYSAGSLKLSISQNYPSPAATVTIAIPVVKDDLDFAKAQVPAGVHVASWKR